jgi:hypothetical protein
MRLLTSFGAILIIRLSHTWEKDSNTEQQMGAGRFCHNDISNQASNLEGTIL